RADPSADLSALPLTAAGPHDHGATPGRARQPDRAQRAGRCTAGPDLRYRTRGGRGGRGTRPARHRLGHGVALRTSATALALHPGRGHLTDTPARLPRRATNRLCPQTPGASTAPEPVGALGLN